MSGTDWTIMANGAMLTWTKLADLWYVEQASADGRAVTVDGTGRQLGEACPLEFDRAEHLSSRQAQILVEWLRSWLPAGSPVRAIPAITTAEVAKMRPHRLGSPVRI